jgi:hypothetical protein
MLCLNNRFIEHLDYSGTYARLRTHNQNMTVAAMQMALMNVWAQRSPAPVLKPSELALDQIALLVDFGVIGGWRLAVLAPWNARVDVQFGQGVAEPVAPRLPYRRSGFRRLAARVRRSRRRGNR